MNRIDPLFIWLPAIALVFSALLSLNARADGIDFRGKFTYNTSDSQTTNKSTGNVIDSQLFEFDQRYNFDFVKTVYPYVTLTGGSIYELKNATSTSQNIESETEEQKLRPYVQINLNNPIYKAGIGYNKIQIKNKITGSPETENSRDELNTNLGWKPVGLPEMNLRYIHIHTYDTPETVDLTDRQMIFDTRYSPWEDLSIDYAYTRIARDDTKKNFETLDQTHNGKIDYSHNFLDNRLSLATSYRIRHNTFEFPSTENVESSLDLKEVLWLTDNTPLIDNLLDNSLISTPALRDGNVKASAGLNIGTNGDATTFTQIVIDFGFPVDVDKIYVWVDRPLSASVANAFSWSIYTSTDKENWTQLPDPLQAAFGVFENRFEIPFHEINTRYIKVATTPLLSGVPGRPTDIYITEIEAVNIVSGQLVGNTSTRTDQNYSLSLRGKVSDKLVLGYDLFYSLQEQDPISQKNTDMTNGINLSYIINRIFTAATSFSQTDRSSNDEKSTSDNYTASLRANYLETLQQTLTFSGEKVTQTEGTSSRNSILLRTNADLYRGWNAFLDAGYSWNELLEGVSTKNTTIRTGTNVIPNEMITVNMNYALTQTDSSDETVGQTSTTRWDVQAFFIPFNALSFNARVSMIQRTFSKTTLYNYSANWAPFSDGTLQLFFSYNETLRPEDDRKTRTIGPSLKWTVSRHFFLDMAYSVNGDENRIQSVDSNNFSANLRVVF